MAQHAASSTNRPGTAAAPKAATEERSEPTMRSLILTDLQFWAELYGHTQPGRPVGPAGILRMLLWFAGLRAQLLYRLAHAAHRRHIPLVPLILGNLNLTLHGFDMPPHIPVGPRFYVPHPVGTVVMAQRLGAGVTLVSGVTIGMRKEPKFPILGDDVYVGAGARVLGEITIGDRAQIGANAVVVKDVPSDSVATASVPATIRPLLVPGVQRSRSGRRHGPLRPRSGREPPCVGDLAGQALADAGLPKLGQEALFEGLRTTGDGLAERLLEGAKPDRLVLAIGRRRRSSRHRSAGP